MPSLSVSIKHVPSPREQPCGVCGANFVPAEDSGSRVLSIKPAGDEVVGALMCGGCHSKWLHGSPVVLNPQRAASK
jgi:hypothetical protein